MKKFNPTALVELQNLLSVKNIERMRDDFIKKSIDPDESPYEIDYEKGLVYYFDGHKGRLVPYKFENTLKKNLWKHTNNLKSEIDTSSSLLNNKEKIKYWQSILNSFEYIQEESQSVFEIFPICNKPKETIQEYLAKKYKYNPISQFKGVSFFTLKPKYSNSDLQKIYIFITSELFLDDEIYSFEDFKSVFDESETKNKLVFNCETPIIINILDNLKHLFTDFTRNRIEESGRFLTKPGIKKCSNLINVGIYQSNLKRGKKPELLKNIQKVKDFFNRNFPN